MIKTRSRIGDRCWLVEWTTELGLVDKEDPSQGHDPDLNVVKTFRCATKEEAIAKAKEVFPQDAYGSVAYWESEFVSYDESDAVRYPLAGYWNACGETEHYESEDV